VTEGEEYVQWNFRVSEKRGERVDVGRGGRGLHEREKSEGERRKDIFHLVQEGGSGVLWRRGNLGLEVEWDKGVGKFGCGGDGNGNSGVDVNICDDWEVEGGAWDIA